MPFYLLSTLQLSYLKKGQNIMQMCQKYVHHVIPACLEDAVDWQNMQYFTGTTSLHYGNPETWIRPLKMTVSSE